VDISPRAIHHLNCGTLCPRGARLLAGSGGLIEPSRLVCHCLLIEGAEGLVLIDTGFGSGDVAARRRLGAAFNAIVRPVLRAEETAASQLRARGFDPGDVRHVLATHLDLDHAGGLSDFPAADVHVLGAELRAAMQPSRRERERYVAAQWAHGPRWVEHDGGGEEWFGFQGVRVVPGSGAEVLLIPLIGHSAGHTGVAVRREQGWLLHCGDAYFHHGQVQTPPHCPPGLAAFQVLTCRDNRRRRENVERLRELAARHGGEVELLCSHDPALLPATGPPPAGNIRN
jgi:glyoxylase-like metal-dependent hydrolase (beta-lactamase superfamily II)